MEKKKRVMETNASKTSSSKAYGKLTVYTGLTYQLPLSCYYPIQ